MSSPRIIIIALCGALLLWSPEHATGQTVGERAGGSTAPADSLQPSPASPDASDRARKHFEQGELHYRMGDFKQAIEEYGKALRAEMHPGYIFNIAQCHRQMGNVERALFFYRLFLSDWHRLFPRTTPPWREETEEHINSLAARLEQQEKERTRQTELRAQRTRCRCPLPDRRGVGPGGAGGEGPPAVPRWMRATSWALVGVGGAAVVSGIVLGGLTAARADAYNSAVAEQRPYGALEDLENEVRTLEQAHLATLIAGAVIAVAGGTFLLWEGLSHRWKRSEGLAALPAVWPEGLGIAATGCF